MKRMTSNEYNPCFNCNFYSSCSHIRENFPVCPERARYDRLAAIEDILGDEYELDRLSVMVNQCMTMREEVAERFSLTAKIPLDRLRELVEADREGRCVVLPCKKGDTVWRIVHDANPHITKDRCTNIKVENREVWISLIGDRVMGGWNFGKLLFLSKKEAEAALKAREQDE